MITIKNLRREKPKYAFDVKVDRSSILGNPYYMKVESQRDLVCQKYKLYFEKMLKADKDFQIELLRLLAIYETFGELNLFCWCAPKRCHAETIREYLEDVISGKREEPNVC